uniref:hypothetical protein n=1 Tax=Streptomyces sp. 1222.5 TaxID=1881026 RepID=UPI003D71CC5D
PDMAHSRIIKAPSLAGELLAHPHHRSLGTPSHTSVDQHVHKVTATLQEPWLINSCLSQTGLIMEPTTINPADTTSST